MIGVITLDRCIPLFEGNAACASTYRGSVAIRTLEGCWNPPFPAYWIDGHLSGPARQLIDTAKMLERDGVKAITCSCGLFAMTHQLFAGAVSIPVYSSSLMLIPIIRQSLPPDRVIGLVTSLPILLEAPDRVLAPIGVESLEGVETLILRNEECPMLKAAINGKAPDASRLALRDELLGVVERFLSNTQGRIGALLLECSDLPPYSNDIRRMTGLPVFDFVSLIRIVESAVEIS